MNKLVAGAAVAASLTGGSFLVATLTPIGLAGAQDDPPPAQTQGAPEDTSPERPDRKRAGGLEKALDSLVTDGTLTRGQADAVIERVKSQHEDRRAERREARAERLAGLAAAAGVSVEDLQERLRGGESLADIAGGNTDAVVEHLLAEATERIDAAVEAGKLTRAEADEKLAELEARITAAVDGEGGRGFGGRGKGRHARPHGF